MSKGRNAEEVGEGNSSFVELLASLKDGNTEANKSSLSKGYATMES